MRKTALLLPCLAIAAYGYGIYSHAYRTFPLEQVGMVKRYFFPDRGRAMPIEDVYNEVSDRKQIDCKSIGKDAAVILIMGQSNAANHGETLYKPHEPVYSFNWMDGRCYSGEDPLLGATGDGGAPWPRLGDALVESGQYPKVILASVAVGGTSVRVWAGENGPASRAVAAARGLAQQGLKVTQVLWQQGESDRQMARSVYIRLFGEMVSYLRSNGIDAPIFVAQSTICANQGNEEIRAAQQEIPRLIPNVYPGPDTDTLDHIMDRAPNLCHFSDQGLRGAARLWFEALQHPTGGGALVARPAPPEDTLGGIIGPAVASPTR